MAGLREALRRVCPVLGILRERRAEPPGALLHSTPAGNRHAALRGRPEPVHDVPGDTRQANSRAGITASVPVARGHAIKISASRGVDARIGSRFDSYGIAYQYVWFDR